MNPQNCVQQTMVRRSVPAACRSRENMMSVEPAIQPEANQSEERIQLAAAYRLIAHYKMDDSIFTHISSRAPADEGEHAFLINPFGLRFDEVTASSLVTVDVDGEILKDQYGAGINKAGFTIHSAVHAARPDVHCVLHTHTVAGVAISSMEEGILPLNQWSLQFYNRTAFHDYEGIALDLAERERLVADLGDRNVMILRNHGLLTCGRTVGEAFALMFNLERACRAQLAIMSSGGVARAVDGQLAEKTARQYEGWDKHHAIDEVKKDPQWDAFQRLAIKHHPDLVT